MPRLVMNAFVNLVTIILSSVGFTLSVIAHFVRVLLPFVKPSAPPALIRNSTLTVTLDKTIIPLVRDDAPVKFRVAPVPSTLLRGSRKATPPDMIAIAQPSSPSMIVLTGGETLVESPEEVLLNDYIAPEHPPASCYYEPSSDLPSGSKPVDVAPQPSLVRRLPNFLRKGRKVSDLKTEGRRPRSSSSSTSRSVSPTSRLRSLGLKREPEESATAHGRIPYVPNPESTETFQTKFVNPLKPKRKSPSPSPLPSPHSTPASKTVSLPGSLDSSPPASTSSAPPQHRRHRSLVSYLQSAIRSPSTYTPESRSPSPHRTSFSSVYSSSSCSSSRSRRSSSFSFSEVERESVPRTQPYGPPYYAAMPVPRPRMQRSQSSRRHARVSCISEDMEAEVTGALSLEFGELKTVESGAGAVR